MLRSTEAFLRDVIQIEWLSRTGEPSNDEHALTSVGEALDSDKRIWKQKSQTLEKTALTHFGDSSIDGVFKVVSNAIQKPLYDATVTYFERRKARDPSYDESLVDAGLVSEMMDCVKRDIAWAAIEATLQRPGFFTALLRYYRAGRWPCSWNGNYPDGCVVVL